jgi:putative ABC transport system permease protein
MTIRNMSVSEGRFLNQTDSDHDSRVCAIGPTVAATLFAGGDPIGKRVLIKGEFFEVVGLMSPKGVVAFQDLDDQIYVPLTTAYNYLFGFNAVKGQSVQYVLVQARNEDEILPAQFQITNLVRLRHGIKPPLSDDFYVRSQMDLVQTSRAMSSVFSLLLAWSAGIALFVGGVGVMNIMLVSVAERTREIGIRKALGAKPKDILLQFVVEATLLSLFGGFGGILLGIFGSYLINFFSHWTTSVTPLSVLAASLVSLTIGLFFGVYPARQAAKLEPIVALRAE